MIKSITVTNHQDESLKMELTNPERSGFAITSITGLQPVNTTINTTDLVTADGSVYNSSRLESRNIVLTLKILSTPSIEYNRRLLFKYFPNKKKIKIAIESDLTDCYIYGYVESNEVEYFSSMTASQISILCPSPYFYRIDEQNTMFSGSTDSFTFPVAFPLNTPIPFSIHFNDYLKTIVYEGSVDTGMEIVLTFLGAATGIRIWNYYTHEEIDLDTTKIAAITGGALQNGDVIHISTVKGNKYVNCHRNGVVYNVLNAVNKDVNWMQLTAGDNVIVYDATTGKSNITLSVYNSILLQGV